MGKQTGETRERILQQGVALVSREGLTGVSFGTLAQRAQMSKSGLFAHFRSKEDAQIQLLEHAGRLADAQIVAPALAFPEGLPRLQAFVQHWLGWAERAGLPGGCPVAAGMFELDDASGPVRDKLLALEAQGRAFLTQETQRAVELGQLRASLDVAQFVWEVCGIYLGHHVARRFLRQPDADERAQTAFAALVDRSRPVRDSPGRA